MTNESNEEWKRLNILKGKCSFSQERIWIDEQIRESLIKNDENLYNYNRVIVYKIDDGYLSIKRLHKSIELVLNKHEIFRTSLEYDLNENYLKQTINKFDKDNYSYRLAYLNDNNIETINKLIYNEEISTDFDLNKGKIFRYHLLKQMNDDNKNTLFKNDYILFIFHHSSIDQYSIYLFLKDLTNAYQNEKLNSNENQLRFIDYSQYERQLDLTNSEEFWINLFSDYNFNHQIKLPYDNKLNDIISTGSFYAFNIDPSLTRQIFRYKQKLNINLFRLFLSTYYIYLFKLTQDTDICITSMAQNRIKQQLNNIIGPFENLNVYRHELDPHESFTKFIEKIQNLTSLIKDNSYYPYQNLISYTRKYSSIKYPFNQISIRVIIDDYQLNFDLDKNLILKQILFRNHQLFKRDDKLTPFHLTLNIICYLDKQSFEFYFEYSNKLFEEKTIELLSQRYIKLLKHLFDVSSNFDLDDEPIYKLSIILPDDERLMQNINNVNYS
ncbi:unnamed protein product [Rotaria magnacalcarata]|uniref:Condensation domain-containing protein n=1 Tax=Rotaria magnacalcarata TaxID=392030 RepID=A0A814JM32_9BILA|nr:unnamed protein product [Rotaria magnacalcarata]CAF1426889.1 unnamed protein product [Rotaria magnacalcarata]CAF2210490.1 unnamed protein product [Rotaria magnacalcarata]CAF3781917.1 unnamed protein product [Rotaria magnacalcarata]